MIYVWLFSENGLAPSFWELDIGKVLGTLFALCQCIGGVGRQLPGNGRYWEGLYSQCPPVTTVS